MFTFVKKYGNIAARKLAQEHQTQARQKDIPVEIAEELLQENQEEIIHRLGNHYVDELLNEV